ncbi:hypothetical protein CTI12_AA237770 [Artemisia annua]|uniref:Uncharacterized protein n=1 Tax=Artemisia annua TaxID=35608 RepID=A0A2U1NQY0_ARTAN|nr:hypothetical protein CTI12_AA237770 [Artemisia annua]
MQKIPCLFFLYLSSYYFQIKHTHYTTMDQKYTLVLALMVVIVVAVGGQCPANDPTKSPLQIAKPPITSPLNGTAAKTPTLAPTASLATSPTPILPVFPSNAPVRAPTTAVPEPVSSPTAVAPTPVPRKKKIKGKKHIAPAPAPTPLKAASPAPIVAPGTSLETPSPGPSDDVAADESGENKLRSMQMVVGCLVLGSALFTLF